MSTLTKEKPRQAKKTKTPASIVWFEIPADKPERAKEFYGQLFGWKIELFPGMKDYWHIDTGGPDKSPDGGLMARKTPEEPITNYINVESIDESIEKVKELGGEICKPKTEIPEMGYFAICKDTEKNTFALWEKA
ncbi:MAG: uncharacterized protein JWM68_5068 [Verrucomicrobiales bacterium]|nr:uncharacterized protein [Verrucomicrobiales bacterium]